MGKKKKHFHSNGLQRELKEKEKKKIRGLIFDPGVITRLKPLERHWFLCLGYKIQKNKCVQCEHENSFKVQDCSEAHTVHSNGGTSRKGLIWLGDNSTLWCPYLSVLWDSSLRNVRRAWWTSLWSLLKGIPHGCNRKNDTGFIPRLNEPRLVEFNIKTANSGTPFTLKLHVFYAFLFNVVAVVKAGSVCQVHEQTHFNLRSKNKKRIQDIRRWSFFQFEIQHSELQSSQSYLLWDFSNSWTTCWGETCSPLQLGHHIWDPTLFSSAGIYLKGGIYLFVRDFHFYT